MQPHDEQLAGSLQVEESPAPSNSLSRVCTRAVRLAFWLCQASCRCAFGLFFLPSQQPILNFSEISCCLAVASSRRASSASFPLVIELLACCPVEADEDVVTAAVQEMAELFFMPDQIFLRHVATGSILQSSLPEDVQEDVDDDEELMREGLAEVAAAAAAIKEPAEDPLQIQAPKANAAAVSQVQNAGMDLGFLSFTGFKSKKVEPELTPPAKKPKLVPSWVIEGAAVHVRRGAADITGTILEIKGDVCRVRTSQPAPQGSDLGAEEREEMLPLPAILPVAPEIGRSVKVVAGDRTGIIGKLVGLAGTEAVVQIGGMCYETLPMTQIAVVSN